MLHLTIPGEEIILVCDGRKALLLKNAGDGKAPNLRVMDTLHAPDGEVSPRAIRQPGKLQNRVGPRSAVEPSDPHNAQERAFARRTAAAINALFQRDQPPGLIVVAPPRTLAEIRTHLTDQVRERIHAEVDKDLTKHPVYEIERVLTGTIA